LIIVIIINMEVAAVKDHRYYLGDRDLFYPETPMIERQWNPDKNWLPYGSLIEGIQSGCYLLPIETQDSLESQSCPYESFP
jgi:hypothetical protein